MQLNIPQYTGQNVSCCHLHFKKYIALDCKVYNMISLYIPLQSHYLR